MRVMILYNLRGCEKSGVCCIWIGLEYIVLVHVPAELEGVYTVTEIVSWLTHEILIRSSVA